MSTEPGFASLEALAGKLDGRLASAVSQFVSSGDTSTTAWRTVMVDELEQALVQHLVGPYSEVLRERGIEPLSVERAVVVVRRALMDTEDLRRRVLVAPVRPDGLVAGFFMDTILNALHQNRVIKSITRRVQDVFGKESMEADVVAGFTGRKRWRTSVVSSRHRDLDFQVQDAGGLFLVGTELWQGPRDNIFNAAQASGCRCYLEFEKILEDGTTVWV